MTRIEPNSNPDNVSTSGHNSVDAPKSSTKIQTKSSISQADRSRETVKPKPAEIPKSSGQPKMPLPNKQKATDPLKAYENWMSKAQEPLNTDLETLQDSYFQEIDELEQIPDLLLDVLEAHYPNGKLPDKYRPVMKFLVQRFPGGAIPHDYDLQADKESDPTFPQEGETLSSEEESDVISITDYATSLVNASNYMMKIQSYILEATAAQIDSARDVTWDNLEITEENTEDLVKDLDEQLDALEKADGFNWGVFGTVLIGAALSITIAVVAVASIAIDIVSGGLGAVPTTALLGALVATSMAVLSSASVATYATTSETVTEMMWNALPMDVPDWVQTVVEVVVAVVLIVASLGTAVPELLSNLSTQIAEKGVAKTIQVLAMKLASEIQQLFSKAWKQLKAVPKATLKMLKKGGTSAVDAFTSLKNMNSQIVRQFIKDTGDKIIDSFMKLIQSISGTFKSPKEALQNTLKGIQNKFEDFKNAKDKYDKVSRRTTAAVINTTFTELSASGTLQNTIVSFGKAIGIPEDVMEEIANFLITFMALIQMLLSVVLVGVGTSIGATVRAVEMVTHGFTGVISGGAKIQSSSYLKDAAEAGESASKHQAAIQQTRSQDDSFNTFIQDLISSQEETVKEFSRIQAEAKRFIDTGRQILNQMYRS